MTFKSDDKRTKKLLFVKNGFRAESRDVGATDSVLNVKLAKAAGGYVPPKPPSGGNQGSDTPSTPDGFKDIPY